MNHDFLLSGLSRETSTEILVAIRNMAGNDEAAVKIWEAPTYEQALAVWEYVTKNGRIHSSEFSWGIAGSAWAAQCGIEG